MRHLISASVLLILMTASKISLSTPTDSSAISIEQNSFSFLVIPYKPMMHLSDADNDLSRYSELTPQEIREKLRVGLLKNLNSKLVLEYETKIPDQDFVQNDERDLELIYNSLAFGQDTVYPLKANAVKDSLHSKKKAFASKDATTKNIEKSYINVAFYDQKLLPDLARKYSADYFIFLNELDIKTNYADCLDLALKIYQRDLKVHYSIFDRNGKQVYGDVAVVKFPSNSNDVDEIIAGNFPGISEHIIASVKKVSQAKQVVVQ